ncbi:hypothetical protein OQI87_08130 [Lactobacillus kefiranofaciens]|uniref:GNAT family N-acetyltransferase n=1 Tax=Lactobacillus kefiranofaciens TaxID=267818 RepID=UPI002468A7BF|nr:hypothetical protein [Lactobacillus kefiranofaciens]MDH5101057.1 hypothetical protein [Lactobacillus kefiranofaciens]
MTKKITIRIATPADAPHLLNIYRYYIEKTATPFDLTVPSLTEFKENIQTTLTKYPYLVVQMDG